VNQGGGPLSLTYSDEIQAPFGRYPGQSMLSPRRLPTVDAGPDSTSDTPVNGRTVKGPGQARPIEGLYESLPTRQGGPRGRRIPSPVQMARNSCRR